MGLHAWFCKGVSRGVSFTQGFGIAGMTLLYQIFELKRQWWNRSYSPFDHVHTAFVGGYVGESRSYMNQRNLVRWPSQRLSICIAYNSLVLVMQGWSWSYFFHISHADCGRPAPGAQPEFTCGKDTLTIAWPTDIKFDGSTTEIPSDLQRRLRDRLNKESRYPILSLVVSTNVPP